MMNFYFTKYSFLGDKFKLIKLNPTGKWKIEHIPYESRKEYVSTVLFIQHKGHLFKSWINENFITDYRLTSTGSIIKCGTIK